jgi:hypothetical protein
LVLGVSKKINYWPILNKKPPHLGGTTGTGTRYSRKVFNRSHPTNPPHLNGILPLSKCKYRYTHHPRRLLYKNRYKPILNYKKSWLRSKKKKSKKTKRFLTKLLFNNYIIGTPSPTLKYTNKGNSTFGYFRRIRKRKQTKKFTIGYTEGTGTAGYNNNYRYRKVSYRGRYGLFPKKFKKIGSGRLPETLLSASREVSVTYKLKLHKHLGFMNTLSYKITRKYRWMQRNKYSPYVLLISTLIPTKTKRRRFEWGRAKEYHYRKKVEEAERRHRERVEKGIELGDPRFATLF